MQQTPPLTSTTSANSAAAAAVASNNNTRFLQKMLTTYHPTKALQSNIQGLCDARTGLPVLADRQTTWRKPGQIMPGRFASGDAAGLFLFLNALRRIGHRVTYLVWLTRLTPQTAPATEAFRATLEAAFPGLAVCLVLEKGTRGCEHLAMTLSLQEVVDAAVKGAAARKDADVRQDQGQAPALTPSIAYWASDLLLLDQLAKVAAGVSPNNRAVSSADALLATLAAWDHRLPVGVQLHYSTDDRVMPHGDLRGLVTPGVCTDPCALTGYLFANGPWARYAYPPNVKADLEYHTWHVRPARPRGAVAGRTFDLCLLHHLCAVDYPGVWAYFQKTMAALAAAGVDTNRFRRKRTGQHQLTGESVRRWLTERGRLWPSDAAAHAELKVDFAGTVGSTAPLLRRLAKHTLAIHPVLPKYWVQTDCAMQYYLYVTKAATNAVALALLKTGNFAQLLIGRHVAQNARVCVASCSSARPEVLAAYFAKVTATQHTCVLGDQWEWTCNPSAMAGSASRTLSLFIDDGSHLCKSGVCF